MSFTSFAEFLAMGGHGLYVWLCYGVGLLVFVANWVTARHSQTKLLRELAQRQRREEANKSQMQGAGL